MSDQLRLLLWLRAKTFLRGGGKRQILGLVVALVILVPLSLALAWALHDFTRYIGRAMGPRLLAEWIHLVFLFVYLPLVVLPLVGFGGSEFYDITKLFHFPVPHRTVFTAQTIGHCLGGNVLFFLPSLIGVVIAIPGSGLLVPLRLLCLFLFIFHAVCLGQLLQLALLNVLRSRRFRDLAMVLGALITGGIYILFRLVFTADHPAQQVGAMLAREMSIFFSPVPSYWASSVIAPGAGLMQVLLFVFGFLPLTGLAVVLASVLQEKAFHGELRTAGPGDLVRESRRTGRAPFPFSLLSDPARAVARKELTLFRREPMVKTLLIQQTVFLLFPIVFSIWGIGGAEGIADKMPWFAIFALLFAESLLALNLLGLEGPGIAHLLLTPVRRRDILTGKVVTYLALFAPVNILLVVGIALFSRVMGRGGDSTEIVMMLVCVTSGLPVLLGLGAVVSVMVPIRLVAKSRRALAQSQTGREGCVLAMLRGLAFLGLCVLMIPVVLVCSPILRPSPLLFPIALLYGAVVLVAGVRWGTSLLIRREEQLVLTLARSPD